MFPRWMLSCGLLLAGASMAFAAEPEVRAEQMPRVPPTEPDKAISTFRVKPGFRIELVAAEPLVVDPIALSFDEDGRCYVVEMRDYSERRPERLGRIRRLEDTNGDGRFDKSTVFAADMPWPTAVICWDGGIFVGATPDLIYFKDTNGDGVADIRESVFTGFAADYAPFATNKLNVQALMNSFNWSLDNRIHGATSFNGGKVKRIDSPFVREWLKRNNVTPSPGGEGRGEGGQKEAHNSKPVSANEMLDLRGRDFSFDPRTLEMRAESGGGQHGMSFDNRGRKYVCSNSSHLQTLMYEERYAARNPYSSLPRALVDIAVDGGAAPVFRISPDEPWRVIRTQWRVSGLVSGPVEGGGRPSGYFTGATGVTLYRGDAFPPEFVDNAFVGDAGGNLVHRKLIVPDGVSVKGVRPADEEKVEFLASTDNWFRPVQMANAPDGCLYICDMYREVIEHPWSLPDSIKKHLDLNSGNDRGRIYRVVPEKFKQPTMPRLSKASTRKLVAMLTLENGWHRDTAARLLYERQPKAAVPLLAGLATNSPVPMIRVQALRALAGLNAFTEDLALAAFDTKLAEVRVQVFRLCEEILARPGSSKRVLEKLIAASDERDPEVRQQLAFTLGTLPRSNRIDVAVGLAKRSAPLYGEMLASSIGDEAGEIFQKLAVRDPGLMSGAGSLFYLLGAYQRPAEIDSALNALATAVPERRSREHQGIGDTESLLGMTVALASGLERSGSSLSRFVNDPRLLPIFQLAQQWATKPELIPTNPALRLTSLGTPIRVRRGNALSVLGYAPSEFVVPTLVDTVERYPYFALEALTALGRHSSTQSATNLLERWPRLNAETRALIITFLLKRTENASALLGALSTGQVKRAELSAAQIEFLRTHRDPKIRAKAAPLLAPERDHSRQEAVKNFNPALSLKGDPGKGRSLFQARCQLCHQFRGNGHALGPDLATVQNGGKEKLLTSILDPNREVNANYLSYAIETKDGESLVGLLVNQTGNSVTLRVAGGTETVVPRANVASMQSQGRSLMPEGLEEGMTMQDMADLLEFILAP